VENRKKVVKTRKTNSEYPLKYRGKFLSGIGESGKIYPSATNFIFLFPLHISRGFSGHEKLFWGFFQYKKKSWEVPG
jgi:hypothetical protein